MQPVGQPQYGAPFAPPPPRARPVWAPIAACCGVGCVVALIVIAVAIATGVRNSAGLIKNADQVARQFIQDVQANRLDKAYASTSTAWRSQSSLADFKVFAATWKQQQGDIRQMSARNTSWYTGTEGSRATLTYAVTGSRHNGVVTVLVVSDGGRLAVQSCNFSLQSSAGPQ